jgi:hypothetical protein
MNTYIVTISKRFLKDHSRAGEETGFKEKIISGEKIHTFRMNFDYWKKRIDIIKIGKGLLSLRQWIGEPYKSKQEEFVCLPFASIQKVDIISKNIYIDNKLITIDKSLKIAKNDGFEFSQKGLNDFLEWLGADRKDIRNACVIHFTKFRYDD